LSNQAPSEPETVLRLAGITKRFGALIANDDISLSLRRGEILALLGENGAGKTTLMNILFGHYVADRGEIEAFGKALPAGNPRAALAAGIGMVHQHFTLADNLTVLDNIALGTEPMFAWRSDLARARARVEKLSSDFGLATRPDATIASLSVGERQRVEILKALYRGAGILILDEPTAVLTPQETDALFATLKKLVKDGLAIIFISHKLNEVMAVSDRVLVLRAGRLVAERRTSETTREELAELMVGRAIPVPRLKPRAAANVAASLETVTVRDAHGRALLEGADIVLREGEIHGLAGVSGNGQGALADLLSGLEAPASGRFALWGESVTRWSPSDAIARGIARIPEDRHSTGLVVDMSVTENVVAERYRDRRFGKRGLLDWGAARRFAENVIKAYDVKCPSPETPARHLSGGNLQKLILGRVLDGEPKIILANQPSRGLDVGAVAYVHEQLAQARARGAAVLLISEDLDEILAMSDVVSVIYRGRISSPMPRATVTIRKLGLMMAGQGEVPHAA
jgi:simple sugar transport system ATP-binding protein